MAKYASLDSLRAIRDWVKEKFQSKLPEISATDNGKVLSVVEGQWEPTELQEELPEVTSADNGKVLAVVAGEWEKAEAPDELPPVQSADNGKVLTVVEGEWAKADVPDELPAVSASDNGKVLGVVEGQWAKTEPEDGLPEVTSSDNGKVLSVVEGAWEPAVPTGGSGLPAVTSEDNGDILSVVDGAWAKGEPGYKAATKERVVLPAQTLTTAVDEESPSLPPSTRFEFPDFPLAPPEYLIVTVNGTKYELPQHIFEDGFLYVYGEIGPGPEDFIFTTIPCGVRFWWDSSIYPPAHYCEFFTAEGGDYAVSISVPVSSATPTDAFKNAVHASGAPGYSESSGSVSLSDVYFNATQHTVNERTLFCEESYDFDVNVLSHAASLKLTVSGNEYTLPRTGSSFGNFGFGAEDFSDGPFFVWCIVGEDSNKTYIAAEESGEYECQVEATLAIIDEVSQDFKTAVNESLEDTLNAPFTLTIHITSNRQVDRITRGPNNVLTSFQELHGHWDNVSYVSVRKDGGPSFSGKPFYVLDESNTVIVKVLDSAYNIGGANILTVTEFAASYYYYNNYNIIYDTTGSISTEEFYTSSKIGVEGNATSHRLSQIWSAIWAAASNGVSPTLVSQDGNTISSALVVSKDAANNLYTVKDLNSGITYTATSENRYPTYTPS